MRKLGLLLLLPVLVILVSGCVGDQQAAELFQSAMNRSESISSYTSSLSMGMDMTVSSMGQSMSIMNMQGTFDVWKKIDKLKMFADLTLGSYGSSSMQAAAYVYYLPDGVYVCDDESASCTKSQETGLPMDISSPDMMFEEMQQLVDNGVVILSYAGTKIVAGRTCDNIKATVDPNKIGEITDLPEDFLTPEVQQAMQGMNFYYTLCLDKETGFLLDYIMHMDVTVYTQGQTASSNMDMQMTVTAFTPNAAISDSEFVLPYEVSLEE